MGDKEKPKEIVVILDSINIEKKVSDLRDLCSSFYREKDKDNKYYGNKLLSDYFNDKV